MHSRVIAPLRAAVAVAALALPSIAPAIAPATASAAPPEVGGEVELVDLDEDGGVSAQEEPDPAMQLPWIKRYTPRRNMWEVGLFGGLWLPSTVIELHERNISPSPNYDLSAVLGLRFGYYPLRHFGLEGELAMMPSRLETEQRAFVSTARAQAVIQLGLWRIVPFAVLGGGVLAVRSEPDAAGRNGDEALHVGGGLKLFLTRRIMLRLEGRDVMSPREGVTPRAPAHSGEFLLGFSLGLGPRKREEPPPPDADGDGFLDPDDACPQQAGIAPDGCPAKDTDGDGFLDPEDACPEQAGAAPDGCPIPDTDGDGYLDPDDACPEEAGVDPDGCPVRDLDNDGLLAPEDQCPEDPETVNGFEDGDGCPDELPDVVKQFTGVIEGIYFATGKAVIRKKSFPKLDGAAKVLADYPGLRVEISGHTDSRGKYKKNMKLSQDRADSVKKYLTDKGIDASRIETRGAGPDQPIGDNKTKDGRQQNRRIEFKLLTATLTPAVKDDAAAEAGDPKSTPPAESTTDGKPADAPPAASAAKTEATTK